MLIGDDEIKYERKHDTINKILLYAVGFLLSVMASVQTYYSSNLAELAVVSSQMTTVINNQSALFKKVGAIEIQVIKNCERSKAYWPEHTGDCG